MCVADTQFQLSSSESRETGRPVNQPRQCMGRRDHRQRGGDWIRRSQALSSLPARRAPFPGLREGRVEITTYPFISEREWTAPPNRCRLPRDVARQPHAELGVWVTHDDSGTADSLQGSVAQRRPRRYLAPTGVCSQLIASPQYRTLAERPLVPTPTTRTQYQANRVG